MVTRIVYNPQARFQGQRRNKKASELFDFDVYGNAVEICEEELVVIALDDEEREELNRKTTVVIKLFPTNWHNPDDAYQLPRGYRIKLLSFDGNSTAMYVMLNRFGRLVGFNPDARAFEDDDFSYLCASDAENLAYIDDLRTGLFYEIQAAAKNVRQTAAKCD